MYGVPGGGTRENCLGLIMNGVPGGAARDSKYDGVTGLLLLRRRPPIADCERSVGDIGWRRDIADCDLPAGGKPLRFMLSANSSAGLGAFGTSLGSYPVTAVAGLEPSKRFQSTLGNGALSFPESGRFSELSEYEEPDFDEGDDMF